MESESRHATQSPVESTGVWAIAAGLLLFGAAFIGRSGFRYEGELFFSLFDDAMISMTYARNLAEGAGLVWNAGEPPVEGYTNLLWVLWMAVLHLLPIPESKQALGVMFTGLAILVLNLFVVRRLLQRFEFRTRAFQIYALAGVAFAYPLVFWTLRGMEVGLVALFFNLCLLSGLRFMEAGASRDLVAFALVASVGSLVRPDFLAPAGCLALVMLAWRPRSGWASDAFVLGGIVCAAVLAQELFRYSYFGEWLPNTYYLKVSGHPLSERLPVGAQMLGAELLRGLWGPIVLMCIHLFAGGGARRMPSQLFAALVLSQILYSVYVGGDAWEYAIRHPNRYLSSILPALIVLSAAGADELFARIEAAIESRRSGSSAATSSVIVMLCIAVAWAPMNLRHFAGWLRDGARMVRADQNMSKRGLLIRDLTPSDTVIAVVWAGAIPYFSHRRSIDLLGKSDHRIARSPPREKHFLPGHTKWDFEYSIGELRPDLIVNQWIPSRGRQYLYAKLGYVRAPEEVGRWATPELVKEVEARLASAPE